MNIQHCILPKTTYSNLTWRFITYPSTFV